MKHANVTLIVVALSSLVMLNTCKDEFSLSVTLQNPSDFDRIEEAVLLNPDLFPQPLPGDLKSGLILQDGSAEVPYQWVDQDQDGTEDHLLLVTNLKAGETKTITCSYDPEKAPHSVAPRVQAELSVKEGGQFVDNKYVGGKFVNVNSLDLPQEHTDHSTYIRYEGPGWESDKVGYRFYLDWRNAIDIFGKSKPDLVLQKIGQDGFDSYHERSDWGMDVLKVGESLGIGSIGMWTHDQVSRVDSSSHTSVDILANGPLEAKIKTHYEGWQVDGHPYDLISTLSIRAGSRMTRHDLSVQPIPENLCTGLVKTAGVEVFDNTGSDSDWLYMASYGKQSLANDKLGMAVIFQKKDFQGFASDTYSDIVLLTPASGKVQYYFLAAWEGEADGIKDAQAFTSYLNHEIQRLNEPIKGQ